MCCGLSFGASSSKEQGPPGVKRWTSWGYVPSPSSLEHQGFDFIQRNQKRVHTGTDPHSHQVAAWWPSYLSWAPRMTIIHQRRQHGQKCQKGLQPLDTQPQAIAFPGPFPQLHKASHYWQSWELAPNSSSGLLTGELPCIKIRDREYFSRSSCFRDSWVRTSKKLFLHKSSVTVAKKIMKMNFFRTVKWQRLATILRNIYSRKQLKLKREQWAL